MKKQTIILRDQQTRARLVAMIQALNVDRRPWQVTLERWRKPRSNQQLRLMWKWVHEVAGYVGEHTGMDADDIHEFFKQKFLTPKVIQIGEHVVKRYTTTELDTVQMSDYMDRIYAWVTSELGLLLPTPAEYGRDEYGRAA